MGLTELIFQTKKAEIGVITLDASVRELHQASATVTRHPIEAETGSPSNVSDNVNIDPLSLQIEGVISNTPAETLNAIIDTIAGGAKDPVKESHQELLNMVLTGQLVTIKTTLLEYPNMVLEKVEVTRDASKGNALYFSATATMVTLVSLETVAGGMRPTNQSTRNTGRGGVNAASDANSAKSSALFLTLF